jgi:hypothetical protein
MTKQTKQIDELMARVDELAKQLIKRDAVLRQAWDALADTPDASCAKTNVAIDAIREVLEA